MDINMTTILRSCVLQMGDAALLAAITDWMAIQMSQTWSNLWSILLKRHHVSRNSCTLDDAILSGTSLKFYFYFTWEHRECILKCYVTWTGHPQKRCEKFSSLINVNKTVLVCMVTSGIKGHTFKIYRVYHKKSPIE